MNRTAFVRGANKGIGFEIARQLGEAGWKVLLGARSVERGGSRSFRTAK
nr:SDR family NAD(P)-dependent oxidoreductase [Paenibacillus sp. FSL P4-0081]